MKALLDTLPARVSTSCSSRRGLTKAETETLRGGSKGMFPNRRRKAVREAEAKASQAVSSTYPAATTAAPSQTGKK